MKKILLLMCAVGAMVLAGCKNNQVGDEALLVGKWQVKERKTTSNDGTGMQTHTVDMTDDHLVWIFTEGTASYSGKNSVEYSIPFPDQMFYELSRQSDNTIWVTFKGGMTGESLFNENITITIHNLTSTEMEWEIVQKGGFEGPITTYEHMKKQ